MVTIHWAMRPAPAFMYVPSENRAVCLTPLMSVSESPLRIVSVRPPAR